jgi:hypothetical protein
VQVHYDEGVAIYIGPEPCVGVREDGDEAWVGEGIGQSEGQRPRGMRASKARAGLRAGCHRCWSAYGKP